MKKLLAITLSIIFVLCLTAGCSQTDGNKDVVNNNGGSQSSETNGPAVKLTLGTVNGSTYENEFIGIGCTLDNNWTFASESDLKALINIVVDQFDENYQEQLESATIVYAMQASDSTTGNNININLEKLDGVNKLITAEKYVDSATSQLETALESAGFANIETEKTEVTVDGTKFPAIAIKADVSGIKVYEKVICIKCGEYIANITLATVSSDTTNEILSKFYIIDK